MKFSEERSVTYFLITHGMKKSRRVESRTSWRETKKIQIQLATTCNKNEQQQDGKNNAELYTEWTKTTWKTFEDIIRQTETGLSRHNWWRMMMVIMMMTNFRLFYISFSVIQVHILKLSFPSKFRIKYTKNIFLGLLDPWKRDGQVTPKHR